MIRTVFFVLIAASLAGCSKDEPEPNPFVAADTGVVVPEDAAPIEDSAPPPDAVVETGPTDCFMNPKTHFEIINACTKATKIKRTPTLPLLLPDGGLPPPP